MKENNWRNWIKEGETRKMTGHFFLSSFSPFLNYFVWRLKWATGDFVWCLWRVAVLWTLWSTALGLWLYHKSCSINKSSRGYMRLCQAWPLTFWNLVVFRAARTLMDYDTESKAVDCLTGWKHVAVHNCIMAPCTTVSYITINDLYSLHHSIHEAKVPKLFPAVSIWMNYA